MIGNPIAKRVSNPSTRQAFFLSSSPFSTYSGGGGGQGRGRGRGGPISGPGQFDFTAPSKPDTNDSKTESSDRPQQPAGIGHGRGRPPILPAFSSLISSLKTSISATGRGRGNLPSAVESGVGRGKLDKPVAAPTNQEDEENRHIRFRPTVEPGVGRGKPDKPVAASTNQEDEENRHIRFRPTVEPGVGRGKTDKPVAASTQQIKEENRHIGARSTPRPRTVPSRKGLESDKPKVSLEEATRRAVSILEQGEDDGGGGIGRGRGSRVRGRGRGRGRGRWDQRGRMEDSEPEFATGLFLGDNADGEKLAERVGVENMNKLIEGFEEMSERVLPSPMQDAYLEALHTNYMIEFEPEYLMGEFDQNPDIDEKPPLPLRDVLEKVKPFIMAYDGIQSQEEWEEVVEETMKNVPLLKEIVDYYSGPDRVTAKKQQEELERVAKTIPASAPASVKRFADRAVLSLQSNPGWGFDRKCQFMDKLAREVNQCYN
ncbi:hypothetical protein JCGZ_00246 [Jatropha curcas]|uniref:Hydroxyproline-rich glycoprotein family protein n=2 Tax=Jatropha curcas TaxID=180498 RepID=A0A067LEC6_JATCU|nr:hypothetical protein JCGZ_00246 [Jatropha curcas]